MAASSDDLVPVKCESALVVAGASLYARKSLARVLNDTITSKRPHFQATSDVTGEAHSMESHSSPRRSRPPVLRTRKFSLSRVPLALRATGRPPTSEKSKTPSNPMKLPFLLRCIALLAAALHISQAHGQYSGSGGYTMYYQSGPVGYMTAPSGYTGFELPPERVGHYFMFYWRTEENGVVNNTSAYPMGLATSSGMGADAVVRSPLAAAYRYSSYVSVPATYTYASGGTAYTYTYNNYTYVPFGCFEWWLVDTNANQESTQVRGTPGSECGPPGHGVDADQRSSQPLFRHPRFPLRVRSHPCLSGLLTTSLRVIKPRDEDNHSQERRR